MRVSQRSGVVLYTLVSLIRYSQGSSDDAHADYLRGLLGRYFLNSFLPQNVVFANPVPKCHFYVNSFLTSADAGHTAAAFSAL